MDRLTELVRGELARFGPGAELGVIVERWPAAVGEAIARNAWPARIGRDGTLHVNATDAIWAFELKHSAAAIAARLGVPAVRFAPGTLPSAEPDLLPAAPLAPTAAQVAKAEAIAALIDSDDLRKTVGKTVSLSLARSASDRPV